MSFIRIDRACRYVAAITAVLLCVAGSFAQKGAVSAATKTAAKENKLPRSLEAVDRTMRHIEDLERKSMPALEAERAAAEIYSFEQQMEEAAGEIDALLKVEPNNVPALLLAARVGRVLAGLPRKGVIEPGPNAEQQRAEWQRQEHEEVKPLHSFCERAITLEPDNAEAHYWNARLYGMMVSVVYRKEEDTFNDLPNAIRFARRAVDLSPGNMIYREGLAEYLLLDSREEEANAAVGEASGWKHPINRLLKDRDALPLPPGAVLMKEQTESYVILMGAPTGLEYPGLRFRTYLLPMSVADAEAFWRTKWPAFRFFSRKDQYADAETSFVQWMRWRGDNLYPALSSNEVSNWWGPKQGIILRLTEYTQVNPDHPLPVPVNGAYCIIDIHNFRHF